ncbi:berberine bridge enzyme-like 24 [Coffea eugenioides]|uniref:berberine bridge enzyme-like 24 n=1 Tax=Coffea eugenioides TaxID=49369 RepID=UPI000F60647F|nr:berberine bridge enzyme-like 24 [Coffea eugenioides]
MSYSTMFQFAFLLLCSISWASASHPSRGDFVQCLLNYTDSPSYFAKAIYTQNSSSFTSVLDQYIHNLRFLLPEVPKPLVIITALTENQIQTAIFCSKKYRLQMRIRSGGHDFEGSSYTSNVPFFVLDMSNFRSISIDVKGQTAWVGAGATVGEVYYSIYEANSTLGFPAAYCPTVGIGGHISGGGYGPLVRQFGLAADNVIDARVIDANGRVLDRTSMGEDLFWAIRGGGGASFAVILGYKLKLVEIPEESKRTCNKDTFVFCFPVAKCVTVCFNHDPTIFLELGLKKQDLPPKWLWIQYFAYASGLPTSNITESLTSRVSSAKLYYKAKSDFVKEPIPENGIEEILRKLNELPPFMGMLEWNHFGGGVMETIPESATPFPHRGNLYLMCEGVSWDEQVVSKQRIDWLRKLYKVIGKYVPNNPRAGYANSRDLDLGVNNKGKTSVEKARIWGAPYFKDNFDRLVQVKTKVDPYNFFKNEQSIPISQ